MNSKQNKNYLKILSLDLLILSHLFPTMWLHIMQRILPHGVNLRKKGSIFCYKGKAIFMKVCGIQPVLWNFDPAGLYWQSAFQRNMCRVLSLIVHKTYHNNQLCRQSLIRFACHSIRRDVGSPFIIRPGACRSRWGRARWRWPRWRWWWSSRR